MSVNAEQPTAYYRQSKERTARVGLIRKLSRWSSKLEAVTSGAATAKRLGHTPPPGWRLDYDVLLVKLRDCRDYLLSAIASGTEKGADE